MASPPTPRALVDVLPASWGPLVDEGRALPVERAAKLVAARLQITVGDAADKLNALPNRHRYLLLEQIGDTGRSLVYAGVDRALVREVAIKIHLDQHEHANRRVMSEVRTMSEVEHPNIVRVFDIDEQDGWLYSVTELCDLDMHAWCPGRAWSEIVAGIIEAGRGLMGVHAAGFVHGDIKPTNILIKDGVAKLADFGFAARPGMSSGISGTPGFIAPELAAGYRAGSGDVFALAASAWACLFGGLPFGSIPSRGPAEAAVFLAVEQASSGEFAAPKRVHAGMPRVLREVIERGMHPDPSERPGLGEWLEELEMVVYGAERVRSLLRWWPAAVGVVVGVGLLGVGVYRAVTSERSVTEIDNAAAPPVIDRARLTNPCDEVQRAARVGDGGGVITAFNGALTKFETYPQEDKLCLANAASSIAARMESDGQRNQALLVWAFASLFQSQVGQQQEALEAQAGIIRTSDPPPTPIAPTQNK